MPPGGCLDWSSPPTARTVRSVCTVSPATTSPYESATSLGFSPIPSRSGPWPGRGSTPSPQARAASLPARPTRKRSLPPQGERAVDGSSPPLLGRTNLRFRHGWRVDGGSLRADAETPSGRARDRHRVDGRAPGRPPAEEASLAQSSPVPDELSTFPDRSPPNAL